MATRIVIEIDRSRCDGVGNCVNAAADISDLDDEGRVRLKHTSVHAAPAIAR